jgi:hypothetical protein
MARELNRDLFGNIGAPAPLAPEGQTPTVAYAKADEVRVLHLHIENLSKRMKEFESRVETMHTKTDDMLAQNKQRFERVQGHFKAQNEQLNSGLLDMNNKIAQVVSKVNERRVSENAIKEMIERHSSVVQSFEVRMQQLQRLISEQELQLINTRSELKSALQELSRLKKL